MPMTDDMLDSERALSAVQDIGIAANDLAETTRAEMLLEDNRVNVKMAAIDRIMAGGDNPMTGKPYSFSAAEAVVNTDAEYQKYLEQQREAVRYRILARGAYDAAVAKARLLASVR